MGRATIKFIDGAHREAGVVILVTSFVLLHPKPLVPWWGRPSSVERFITPCAPRNLLIPFARHSLSPIVYKSTTNPGDQKYKYK